jgi:subtilisin
MLVHLLPDPSGVPTDHSLPVGRSGISRGAASEDETIPDSRNPSGGSARGGTVFRWSALWSLLFAVTLFGLPPGTAAGLPSDEVVVVMREGPAPQAAIDQLVRRLGLRLDHRYAHAVHGFAARVTVAQRRALEMHPAVAFLAPDTQVELTAPPPLPAGIDRVETEWSPTAAVDGIDEGVDADIAIIDTGIQPDHPDLRVVGGYNCTSATRSAWQDAAGHGTHVAGSAAARDNGFGVTGVAPGARLWSVRVFDANSYSKISWIVCGIDWITGQRDPADPERPLIEVANMSLRDGGGDDGACGMIRFDVEHAAICRAVAAGIVIVAAAGNDRTTTTRWRPAAYDEVITVSALADFDGYGGGLGASTCSSFGSADSDDTFANFSNYGPDVDLIAPGKCVRSTIMTSGYGISSGTSMAAPHVAGAVALYRIAYPAATPEEVRRGLIDLATFDWRTGTDPDGVPDPLLNVSGIGREQDVDAPVVEGPGARLAGGRITADGGIPLRLSWAGSDDVGISRFDLRRSVDGGSWSAVRLPTRTATAMVTRVTRNSWFTYRHRAFDAAGNASPWGTASARARVRQNTSSTITYRGTWSSLAISGSWGGDLRRSRAAGASATMAFTARGVSWVSTMGPGHGRATVLIDGQPAAVVDLYRSTTSTRRVVFAYQFEASERHTIRVVVEGTSGRPRVDVDAFVLLD